MFTVDFQEKGVLAWKWKHIYLFLLLLLFSFTENHGYCVSNAALRYEHMGCLSMPPCKCSLKYVL